MVHKPDLLPAKLPAFRFAKAIARQRRSHWTAAQAREELHSVADEMRIGRITWDEVDDRRVVGRTQLGYLAVATSVLLPCEQPTGASA